MDHHEHARGRGEAAPLFGGGGDGAAGNDGKGGAGREEGDGDGGEGEALRRVMRAQMERSCERAKGEGKTLILV